MARGTLVDANVILDLVTEDDIWVEWSEQALASAAEAGPLYINPIIYAEVSVGFTTIEQLEDTLPESDFRRLQLPWEAAFLAGKVFLKHRRSGGAKRSPLPDFYIGAHAVVAEMSLVTRDVGRYRTYFPGLHLISPHS